MFIVFQDCHKLLLQLENFLVFGEHSQHQEALTIPVQSTGQPLLSLLRIQCLQANYVSNKYCCFLRTQQVFSLKYLTKAKLPVSDPLSLLSPWLDSPDTSRDGIMVAWQRLGRGCWL